MDRLVIAAGAEQDYEASLLWYAERSRRAAKEFEIEFARALDVISKSPEDYPLADDRHRFYLLKRYPFQVIYRRISDDQLLIVAVVHASRRPGYWSSR